MQLPAWDELIEKQLDVLEHPLDQSLLVVGPPGSGKTVLALRRAQMAAHAGHRVVIITYNRMLRRLLALLNNKEENDTNRIRMHTMHSYIGSHYRRHTGEDIPTETPGSFEYLWRPMLERLVQKRSLPDERMHLSVDEGQDLPADFFRYAADYIAPRMTVFADEDQALRNQQTTLMQIKKAARMDDPILFSLNHRNAPEVARVAEHFHSGRLPAAEVQRAASGEAPVLLRSRNLGATAERVSNWYSNRGGSIGIIVNSNGYGRKLKRELTARLPKERVDFYDSIMKNEDRINVLHPGVTILNKESVKGQEFDTVFLLELECFIPCTNDAKRRAMYMMCSRARDNLFLVYGPNDLSPKADAALPGQNILERR